MPRASILLPVYDGAATLAACLKSIARQSEPDFECVVVDDGSRDGSAAIARDFGDARVRVLALPHRGLVPALNDGLAACRAPVVVRMDADDLMHRDRLRAELAAIDGGLDAAGCHVRLFPRAGLSEGRRAYERWLNAVDSPERVLAEAFVECPIAHPTLAVRRELLAELGYRDEGWPEDWDLVLRLLERGARIGVVPRRLLSWRDGPARLSRTAPAYGIDRFMACRAHFLARWLGARAWVLWGYGGTGKALRRELARLGKEPRAIVELHPGRLGQRIFGAEVIAPERLPEVAPPGSLPIAVSVAGAGPRAEIRAALSAMGYRERHDYVCCA